MYCSSSSLLCIHVVTACHVLYSVYAAYNHTIGGNVDPTARNVADAIVSPPLGLDPLPTCSAPPRFLGVGPTRGESEGREQQQSQGEDHPHEDPNPRDAWAWVSNDLGCGINASNS